MSQLLPSSRPAWLAPVWEERSHSQPSIRCVPSDSQRAIVGTCPSRTASRRTPSPRPSISNMITPGTSVRFVPARAAAAVAARRAGGRRPRRRRAAARRASTRAPARTRSPGRTQNGRRLAVDRRRTRARPSPALSASEPSPNVRIVSGSASRVTSGHRTALMQRHHAGDEQRGGEGERFDARQQRGQDDQQPGASTRQQHDGPDREPQEPPRRPHALSGMRARRSLKHWLLAFSAMVHGAVSAHRAGTSADRIVFLGHATVLIELDGVRLLTDPLLRARVAHLRRQAPLLDASADRRPGRGADLASAPRSPRPGLAAARWVAIRRCSCRPAPAHGCAAAASRAVTELERGRGGAGRRARRSPRWRLATTAGAVRAARAPRRSATSCAAAARSTSPATRSSSRRCPQLPIGSTSRSAGRRMGPDARPGPHGSARRRARGRRCCARALPSRCTGERCCPSALPVATGTGWATRRAVRPARGRLAPGVEVRMLAPGQQTAL